MADVVLDRVTRPVQVQIWNGCERHEKSYSIDPDGRLRLRGVEAAFYESGIRLELYSGNVTIVIFSARPDREELLAAAKSLRSLDGTVRAGERLPERVPAVMDKQSAVCQGMAQTAS
jgi:hypothetical protein